MHVNRALISLSIAWLLSSGTISHSSILVLVKFRMLHYTTYIQFSTTLDISDMKIVILGLAIVAGNRDTSRT